MTDDPFASFPERRGLYSVAQIHHVLRVEFNRARRHRYPLSCFVLAVDRLDTLRDRHGYEAKERVLDGIVSLLRGSTRSSDYLGRTADDRLMAVVSHTDPAGVRVLARRLIEGARATRLEHLPERFPITLSIGLASTAPPTSPSASKSTSPPGRPPENPSGSEELHAFHDSLLAAAEAALADAIAAGGDRFAERVGAAWASSGGRASPKS